MDSTCAIILGSFFGGGCLLVGCCYHIDALIAASNGRISEWARVAGGFAQPAHSFCRIPLSKDVGSCYDVDTSWSAIGEFPCKQWKHINVVIKRANQLHVRVGEVKWNRFT